MGWIFNPNKHMRRAPDKWVVVCHSCNQAHYPNIGNSAATRRKQTSGAAPGLNDIKF
jgi:hypothetical protein